MFNVRWLRDQASRYSFIEASLEKMCRLVKVLRFIMSQEDHYVLKGGTAINLVVLPLPRLSMDIDLNFVSKMSIQDVKNKRETFNLQFDEYMKNNGYKSSSKTRYKHNDEAKRRCIELLPDLIVPNRDEKEFLHRFRYGEYVPELVFGDYPEIVARISEHPGALLKCPKVFSQERSKIENKDVKDMKVEQNIQDEWIEPGLF